MDNATEYETPLKSPCHQTALVWYRPDAGRYVLAWPSDPNLAHALANASASVLRCARCNNPH